MGETARILAFSGSTREASWNRKLLRVVAAGAEEYLNLELYVAWRGRGLLIETPAVRK